MTGQPLALYAPQLFRGSTRVFTVNRATSLKFICPLCRAHHIILPLRPVVQRVPWRLADPAEPDTWKATGLTTYDITLTPSVHVDPGCGFHAMISNGRVQMLSSARKHHDDSTT